MGKYGVTAKLVWDGTDEIRLPEEMGVPRPDQIKGTVGERLSEVAGRICYDSCGTGRSSGKFHEHILEVGHLSVYEHHQLTIRWDRNSNQLSEWDFLWAFVNRPGVWIEPEGYRFRVTFNPRVVLDWAKWNMDWPGAEKTAFVGKLLRYHAEQQWPQITPCKTPWDVPLLNQVSAQTEFAEPYHDEEKWISVYMSGSRGFSHEQVRHGDRSAISQRSTRFVDESESPWIDHPLVQEYDKWLWVNAGANTPVNFMEKIEKLKTLAKAVYGEVVETLQPWLIDRGVDKFTARKQARGAARGYLGNALETQMIFSASVGQWKRMLRQRCNPFADAEIRAVYVQVLEEILKKSRYGDDFKDFKLTPSSDGIGECAIENKEGL